jgi:prepilin-type N-terminal cleavage/methylation domain-containing protein
MHKKDNKGFTIIEVLIVLAIAGLILLIVFLAVPALQRNSRNTSIKNDVASVLGGVTENQAANNGSLPTNISASSGVVTYDGTNDTTINIQGDTGVSVGANMPAVGSITIDLQNKCGTANNNTGTAFTAGAANTRAVAAYYFIETSSGVVGQCSDS